MARTRTRSLQSEDKNNHKTALEHENGAETARKDRPTPSARDAAKPRGAGSKGILSRIPVVRGLVAYFRGVVSELQKVTWPLRDEAQRLTAVVLGVTAAFAISLGLLDAFFSWWFQQAFHADSEWIFLLVGAGVLAIASGTFVAFRKYV